jgi:hypothetical protein
MKTVLIVALVVLNIALVQSQWIIVRLCPGAPTNYVQEVRAVNGYCARIEAEKWRQVYCDDETATSYTCSDDKCKNCTKEFSTPVNKCNNFMKATCQKNQPNLPDLIGQNYFILGSRYTCDSELNTLIASNPYCFHGQDVSFSAKCAGDQATMMSYSNANCSGEPNFSYNMPLNQCENGKETYCNEN